MTPLTFNCSNHPHKELDWTFDSVYNRFLIETCPLCEADYEEDLQKAESDGYDNGRSDGFAEGYDEAGGNNDD